MNKMRKTGILWVIITAEESNERFAPLLPSDEPLYYFDFDRVFDAPATCV